MINDLPLSWVRGAKPRAAWGSDGLAAAADQVRQARDQRLPRHVEPAAQVIPERDGVLGAGLGETEKGIAAFTAGITAGSGTDLAADHLAADVVFRAVGVQRYLRPLQHPQQFG